MNLWIRSQDKTSLFKPDNLYVNGDRIVYITSKCGRATIGKYKTEERALEVLDEIQHKLGGLLIAQSTSPLRFDDEEMIKKHYKIDALLPPYVEVVETLNNIIYQMPKE